MSNPAERSLANQRTPSVQAKGNNENEVSLRTLIAVGGSLLGAFMAILDIQITNSALKDIQGALNAGRTHLKFYTKHQSGILR